MSLDVYLEVAEPQKVKPMLQVPYREDGQLKMLSLDEWSEKFPGRVPVVVEPVEETTEVYWSNITHNLHEMAHAAGVGNALWEPNEIGITKAEQLINVLQKGLLELLNCPEIYKEYNPSNGWGTYDGLVEFVSDYLDACKEYPEATIYVSR